MSELMKQNTRSFRDTLLTTASSVVLLTYACSSGEVRAEERDRPTVWIELGGQLERLDGGQQAYAPPFLQSIPHAAFETVSPISVERLPRYSAGLEGKVSLQPSGTDWLFSAAARYGRSNSSKRVHQQTKVSAHYDTPGGGTNSTLFTGQAYTDTRVKHDTSSLLLDFQAGKDIGVGAFGKGGTSNLSFGVRLAQFSRKSHIARKGDPDLHFDYKYYPYFYISVPVRKKHTYSAVSDNSASFWGIGPSISWTGSQPVAGSTDTSEVSLDWGVNAALLFGRQKATGHHQTTVYYQSHKFILGYNTSLVYENSADHDRSRSVIVPNIGGFAGFSVRYANAKASLGYRADFFFGAMDGGIDTRKTYDRNFYGPFAKISIGLGG